MSAPSSPFATTAAVAYLMGVSLKQEGDFTDATTPTKATVTQFIQWISAQIEMQFAMAGYIVPLSELENETWPTSQTYYLQLITVLGATAMAGGWSQKPMPAIAPGRPSGTGNIFQDLYNSELAKIWNMQTNTTQLNFRARYRIGSAAQVALTDPMGPLLDFNSARFDPMRHLPLWEMSEKVQAIQEALYDRNVNWDYMWGLFGVNQGLGPTLYEPWPAPL